MGDLDCASQHSLEKCIFFQIVQHIDTRTKGRHSVDNIFKHIFLTCSFFSFDKEMPIYLTDIRVPYTILSWDSRSPFQHIKFVFFDIGILIIMIKRSADWFTFAMVISIVVGLLVLIYGFQMFYSITFSIIYLAVKIFAETVDGIIRFL